MVMVHGFNHEKGSRIIMKPIHLLGNKRRKTLSEYLLDIILYCILSNTLDVTEEPAQPLLSSLSSINLQFKFDRIIASSL